MVADGEEAAGHQNTSNFCENFLERCESKRFWYIFLLTNKWWPTQVTKLEIINKEKN